MLDSTEKHAAEAVELVPNPACKPRPITDTELLDKAMSKMKVIADENYRLRSAIKAVASANESNFNATLATAIELATAPVPYTLADFLPALRHPRSIKEPS
ncbi:hypothetical protein ABIE61_000333 [Marinobacterium sp. MBR-111]|uniref:hypothetical protein n=1 Tax=Marinobacterium sp. MBR-111 TaxID=3156463 RepID=UPI00339A43A8